MLKLHGFSVSNYYNMVKLALLEKGLEFELVNAYPNQDEEFLQKSPVGKIPALETEKGFLCETSVILDYIEQTYPESIPLLPSDTFEQARVKELMQIVQLYIELPARRCFSEVFFGGKVSDEIKQTTQTELVRGVKALQKRACFSPYLAGNSFTLADIVFIYSIDLACLVYEKLFNADLLENFEVSKSLVEKLKQRPHVQQILNERDSALKDFINSKK